VSSTSPAISGQGPDLCAAGRIRVTLPPNADPRRGTIATCARCDNEFELVAEWHRTITEEATGQSLTLVYTSVVCDDCLTESEVEQRAKWKAGDPVDPC
jgi:hypothetical protein